MIISTFSHSLSIYLTMFLQNQDFEYNFNLFLFQISLGPPKKNYRSATNLNHQPVCPSPTKKGLLGWMELTLQPFFQALLRCNFTSFRQLLCHGLIEQETLPRFRPAPWLAP